MKASKDQLLESIRNGGMLSTRQQISLTAKLSTPAIMAQLSFILMQYIDASMVGHLGAECSAAVGLVSTSTWLIGGLAESLVSGFSVLVAHRIGASDNRGARDILRQAITVCVIWGVFLSAVGVAISGQLPHWLNGGEDICPLSSNYFMIFSLGIPFFQLNYLAASMLRSAGNIKVPSILNVVMCLLDIVLNYFLIYPGRDISIAGISVYMPGAGLGVTGAALGSAIAFTITSVIMTYYMSVRSRELKIYGEEGSYKPTKSILSSGLKISVPIGLERSIMALAATIVVSIVAPLGNVSISADTLAITIEGICYMPGYGICDAAITLIGQCIGAKRKPLAKSFAKITVLSGMIVLSLMSIIMYLTAEFMMRLLTPVDEIVELGAQILRIEAFAEPFFGAAIVCYGVFVGAGNSLMPNIINMASMWLVRIPMAMYMAQTMGLKGVWIAMCLELIVRGSAFLIYLRSPRWLNTKLAEGK
ncbi:MAG: MATE family efflux transporter [Bacteroidales bacterium]|nr:MATE family efflux transporter [Bacteroidales bacterium]